jgi:hypothetical protein
MRVLPVPPKVWLGAVVLLAVALRLGFFIGLVSGDPQDDGIYYLNAFALYDHGPTELQRFRTVPPGFLANPIDQFHVRPMVTYPLAASFALFGPGEVSAVLWPFLCSIGTVVVVYRLGTLLHDSTVGILTALLCAFYPLEVINGTRILSDVPVGFFSSLALLLFLEGTCRRDASWYLASGASAAGAYLANARGLIFLAALLLTAIVLSLARKIGWKALLLVVGGFAIVFSGEALAYAFVTGDPLLSYHIQGGASRFKYLHEPVASARWGWIEVKYTNGAPFELLRSVLLIDARPVQHFGFFFYLFLGSAVVSLLRRQNLLLVSIATGLLLYLEFGPLLLAVDWERQTVEYMMVFKQERFLLMLTGPLLIVGAWFLRWIARRSRVATAAVLLGLFTTSIAAVAASRDFYRAGLADLRSIASDVRAHPELVYFGDLWAIGHLEIFTRYRASNVHVLDGRATEDQVKGACLVLGGSRGVELLADYVESTLPPFARSVLDSGVTPPGWTLVEEVRGPRTPQRRHDLRVYCIAP